MPDDLLMAAPPKAKKKKAKKKKAGLNGLDDTVGAKHHLVHVNVNVVNSASGDHEKKKGNDADHALRNLRGY